jgi:hypothetical protein
VDEAELLTLIHAAFDDVKHPGDGALSNDDTEIQAFYGVEHWQDMAQADLEQYNSALSFLNPMGLQFFLPAFLVWVIRNYRTSDAFTVDSTIYALDAECPADPFKVSKLSALDSRQRLAVVAFLEFMFTAGADWCDWEAARGARDNLIRAGLVEGTIPGPEWNY